MTYAEDRAHLSHPDRVLMATLHFPEPRRSVIVNRHRQAGDNKLADAIEAKGREYDAQESSG